MFFMRIFIAVLILIFNIQSLSKADDIRDFQIEGMSVGDSLLDYFSEEKLKNSIVDWYDDLEKEKYIPFALNSERFKDFDFVDVFTKYGDKSYKIDTVAGVIYFSSDKKIKNINDCYNEQIKIANELHLLFKNAKKKGPIKKKFLAADPTGKSTYNDIYLLLGYQDYFKDRYEVIISCYDWSDHFENREDHMYIGIRSIKISSWLD